MINASVAIQMLPTAENTKNMLKIIDEVIAYIKSFNLNTVVCPFETVIEGEFNELMDIVKGCHEIAIKAGAPSLMSYIKISYHADGGILTIEEKTAKHR